MSGYTTIYLLTYFRSLLSGFSGWCIGRACLESGSVLCWPAGAGCGAGVIRGSCEFDIKNKNGCVPQQDWWIEEVLGPSM